MILVEPRRTYKSRTISTISLAAVALLIILMLFIVRAGAEDHKTRQNPPAAEKREVSSSDQTRKMALLKKVDYDYDIIIRGGTLVGESRILGAGADIAIRDGVIYAIGDLAGATAAKEIDAAGIKYAIVDGHLAFAVGQRSDDSEGRQEGLAAIGNGGNGGKATTETRSDAE